MKHRRASATVLGFLVAFAALLLLPGGASALTAASFFSSDAEGWMTNGATDCFTVGEQPDYFGAGGNPGGYISDTDNEPGTAGNDDCLWAAQAPSAVAGDLRVNYGGTLAYDLRTSGAADWGGGFAIVKGDGSSIQLVGPTSPPASGVWTGYPFTLTEHLPGVFHIDSEANVTDPATQQQFLDVLSDVSAVLLLGDLSQTSQGDSTDIDNFTLTEPANPPDSDNDGVPDASDNCDEIAGPASNGGCPVSTPTDSDGDGVADASDNCPAVAGPASNAGCPVTSTVDPQCDEARAKLKKAKKKLRKLKQNDAPRKKIKKAKKRVKKAKNAVAAECSQDPNDRPSVAMTLGG